MADVAVQAPTARLHAYAVPTELHDIVQPGALVRVPFGRGRATAAGFCVRVTERVWDHTRKPVLEAEAGPAWLSHNLVELGLWVSDYYAATPWKTFIALLPSGLRKPRTRKVVHVALSGRELTRRPTDKQAALLTALANGPLTRAAALQQAGVSAATLRTLEKHGIIERTTVEEAVPASWSAADEVPACAEDGFALTSAQQAALDRITRWIGRDEDAFRVFLLFGVPGSGKTEVYVRAMRAALAAGRQAILLIPEIALATQIVERLARRFARVAVLHSQLTAAQRRDTLAAIADGLVDVVIGTRSAVFAPCPRLGLIVVDEEQESSLKNIATPLYHARDVAIKRGQLEGVPVVLGSGTPALETWHNATQRDHYELVRLDARVPGARLPQTRLVRAEAESQHAPRVLSMALEAELRQTVSDGQQAILLHNRRGYAVFLRCTRCGLIVKCARCGRHMVFHHVDAALKCHHCGLRRDVPAHCLDETCNGRLVRSGLAIQRLEEELARLLPDARLLRLDSDTMKRRDDYQAALARFEGGAADILLGTQMVAKGLDFPGVRLVGVIDADAALSLPDFRAAERVFQLIVQVVGRAGRRSGDSLALVQTGPRTPPVIEHALALNYELFARDELRARAHLGFPPFTRIVRLVLADAKPGVAERGAATVAERLRTLAGRVHAQLRVGPPEPCPVPRLRDMLRYQVLVRGPRGASMQQLLSQAQAEKLLRARVTRLTVDVDPVDLL